MIPTHAEAQAASTAARLARSETRRRIDRERAEVTARHSDESDAADELVAHADRVEHIARMSPARRDALRADRPVGGAQAWRGLPSEGGPLAYGREWTPRGQRLRALLAELER